MSACPKLRKFNKQPAKPADVNLVRPRVVCRRNGVEEEAKPIPAFDLFASLCEQLPLEAGRLHGMGIDEKFFLFSQFDKVGQCQRDFGAFC